MTTQINRCSSGYPYLLAAIGFALLFVGNAVAAPILVNNHSFEDPALLEGGVGYFNTPGWTQFGGGVLWTEHPVAGRADNRDGNNAFAGNGAVGNGVRQDLGVNFVDGMIYTLTVKITRPGHYFNNIFVQHDSIGKISLHYADTGAEVASHTETYPWQDPSGVMQDFSVVYTATAADAAHGIRVQLAHMDSDGVYFDHVRLDAEPIPEPASLVLMGMGGLMLLRRRG